MLKKNNNKFNLFLILNFLLSTTVIADEKLEKFGIGKVVFINQELSLDVEIATNRTQRAIGLMFRKNIPYETGMLFVYETTDLQRVWMKNTLVPLDILFISELGEVVSFIELVQPCKSDSCVIYDSKIPVKYMLEVNAGFIKQERIQVGQKVLLIM